MKTLFKVVGGLAGAALLLAVLAALQVWFFRPFSIKVFYETAFLKQVLDEPELLTQLRILEPMGIDGHNDELTDASPAREQRRAEEERRNLEWLHQYDRASLNEADRTSYDVLNWYLQNRVDGEPWIYHDYPVNQMFGVQSSLPTFMLSSHQIGDAKGARDYVSRLRAFPQKFAGVIEGLELRESRGVLPPRLTVEKVLEQMRQFVAVAPAEHVLATHLRDKLSKLESIPQAERDQLARDGEQAVAEAVIPAYRSLIAFFETLLPKVKDNHGVWALPDGDKYYAWCVQNHTTLKVDADTVHATGLAEVARIESEMNAILAARGLTQGSVGTRLAKLAEDPAQLYPDSDEGRAQILADFQAMIDEINAGLDEHFSLRPAVGVEVKRIEPFREKTAPGAHYLPAPMDRSRPAVFYANLRDVKEVHRWGMRTLAYHEAVPGHHFQIAIAQEIKGVPTFRKLPLFTVYSEGWALYSEQLAKELGFVKDPLDDLGRLQAEMFRAVRLVVDTGMHHKRWTREQAIAYMLDKTGQSQGDVVAEIERYLVAPGQALAYKTGMLKILELRDKQRAALGERFSLKDFHTAVLGGGPMPLPVLEARLGK
ncbi:MAG TPA: DUF885 domain-containing protein [Verrucomicrobiae bacterium]|nr:DUF885 domain-containing protein [Verrucomicrobiae bacterium]